MLARCFVTNPRLAHCGCGGIAAKTLMRASGLCIRSFLQSLYMIFISPDSARDLTGSGDGRDGHGNGGAFLLANYTRRDFT